MTLANNLSPMFPNNVPSSSFAKNASSVPKKERRRGAKRKTVGGSASAVGKDTDAPMFLRKAYFLINSCDPQIASWSKDGMSFWVKDTDKFSSEEIPKCFKHNHLSSFVRQLNFYGFRKLRDEHIELENVDEAKSKWCHFHHPKFQRGRPELLKEISKNTHKEVAEKTELEALRSEVKDLKSQIKNLKSDMGILASLVGDLTKQVQNKKAVSGSNAMATLQPPAKKQKSTPSPLSHHSTNAPKVKPEPIPQQRIRSREISNDTSVVSFTSEDEEFLSSLFAEGNFDTLPDEIVSA